MNACEQCIALNGQTSDHPRHSDLEYVATFGGGVVGGMPPMWDHYLCRRCGCSVRLHTENGETPNEWEVLPKADPWYANGYLVHTEVQEVGASGQFASWYWLTAPFDDNGRTTTVVPRTKAAAAAPNKFTAWATASTRGKLHAESLPPG